MTKEKGQTIQWPKKKDRQYNDQRKRTDNTMTKKKDKQYNDQRKRTDNTMTKEKGQTIQ